MKTPPLSPSSYLRPTTVMVSSYASLPTPGTLTGVRVVVAWAEACCVWV
jgi:hypothetical protein